MLSSTNALFINEAVSMWRLVLKRDEGVTQTFMILLVMFQFPASHLWRWGELKPAGTQTSTSFPSTGCHCLLIIPAVSVGNGDGEAAGGPRMNAGASGRGFSLSREQSEVRRAPAKPFIRLFNYIIVWIIEVNRFKWPRLLIIYEDQKKTVAGQKPPPLQGFTLPSQELQRSKLTFHFS